MHCLYIYPIRVRQGEGRSKMAKTDNKKVRAKPGKKDSQLILRLNKADRDAFVKLCKQMDTSAAREVRGFIRKFLKKNG